MCCIQLSRVVHCKHLPVLPIFIFDIGGVVIIWRNNDPLFKQVAKRYRVPFAEMKQAMLEGLSEFEDGRISARKYIEESLVKVGKKIDNVNANRLLSIPFEKIAKDRIVVIKIITSLRHSGFWVYGFSNTSAPHVKIMNNRGWTTKLFDNFFASCKIGHSKPQRLAFETVLGMIKAKPHEVVFIDNSQENILGAKHVGIKNSIRYHSIASLKKDLRRVLRQYK